jgi:DNA-binding response OmpR family regulator
MMAYQCRKRNQMIIVTSNYPDYLSLVEEVLREEGYTHIVCVPCMHAEATIRREQPGLVLMDIPTPVLTSEGPMIERLRQEEATTAIPIILCTTNLRRVSEQGQHLCTQGCDFLEKPFELETLIDCVQARIGPPELQL